MALGITVLTLLLSFLSSLRYCGTAAQYRPPGPPIPRDVYPTGCFRILNPNRPKKQLERARRLYCDPEDMKCACSCNEECRQRQSRIQKCCIAKGVNRGCLHFCRYEMDPEEFACEAEKCTHMFQHWGYCSADNPDTKENLECCKARGAPDQCLMFCESKAPTRTEFHVSQLACGAVGSMMLQCHAENLPNQTTWTRDNKVFPTQRPFFPLQKKMLQNIGRQLKCDSKRENK